MNPARAVGIDREYRQFLDALPAFVVLTAPDGSALYRNSGWRNFTGVSETESIWESAVHPEDKDTILAGWQRARESGSDAYDAQYRVRSSFDGDYHWVRTHTTAVRDAAGTILYYIGIGFVNDDFGERNRAESQYNALFDSNVIGICVATIDTAKITEANDEFLRMLGYARADFERDGIDWRKITPPEWEEADNAAVESLIARGFAPPFEKEYYRKDGSRVPVLIGTATFDAANSVIAYALDLSIRKRAIARFETLAELGRALSGTRRVEDVYDVVLSTVIPKLADWAAINVRDAKGDFIIGAVRHRDAQSNDRLQVLSGTNYLKSAGNSGSNEALRTGEPIVMTNYSETVIREAVEDQWADFILELHPHSSVVVPLIIGGEVFGTLAAHVSDTSREHLPDDATLLGDIGLRAAQALENARVYEAERQLLDRLSRSEREYRALADAVPVIVWSARADGWIDWYNRRWYEFTGQTPESAAGWGWQAAHHPEDLPQVMERWPDSIRTGEPFEMEFRLRRHDGQFRTMLTRILPLKDEAGQIVRWYGSNVDIEEQREAHERTRRVADTLQGVFLPEYLPRDERLRIDGFYQAAETDATVGGDWFDAITLDDGTILLSIGDVAGHGLDASVIAGRLRFAARDYGLAGSSPDKILELVNRIMVLEHPGVYATAIVATIDPERSCLHYSSAGHPPPVLVHNGVARSLALGGLPLGINRDWAPTVHEVNVERDDLVALYTDGVIEPTRDILAGETALAKALEAIATDPTIGDPADRVRTALLGQVDVLDDAALLLVQFSDTLASTETSTIARTKRWRFHSSDALTARMSRHELLAFAREHTHKDEQLFFLELIIGELLANTVEHAPGLVEIELHVQPDRAIVTVDDSGPGFEGPPVQTRDPYDEDGRGLFLVRSLSKEMTIAPLPGGGTRLHVEIPLA